MQNMAVINSVLSHPLEALPKASKKILIAGFSVAPRDKENAPNTFNNPNAVRPLPFDGSPRAVQPWW